MTVFPLEDLPMFWQARANALRFLDKHRSKSDAITLETARVYEECANELRAAMSADNTAASPKWGET